MHSWGVLVEIQQSTDVSVARRTAARMAEQAAIGEDTASDAGIVVTEAASNVLKHAGGGQILLRAEAKRMEVIAIDKGPGIADTARCFEDGYSTAGSSGTGLGAITRLSTFRQIYSVQGGGTALVAHVGGTGPDGIVSIPYPGETVCGDGWTIRRDKDGTRMAVIDGLGHGTHAAAASERALHALATGPGAQPADTIQSLHEDLRATRGAAASVADISPDGRTVDYAGVGNVVGVVVSNAQTRRQMISSNGTLGHQFYQSRPYRYPLERSSLVVLHSDGLSANWSLDKYPGLFSHHPSLIGAVLFRDYRRVRDDATVIVVRTEVSS